MTKEILLLVVTCSTMGMCMDKPDDEWNTGPHRDRNATKKQENEKKTRKQNEGQQTSHKHDKDKENKGPIDSRDNSNTFPPFPQEDTGCIPAPSTNISGMPNYARMDGPQQNYLQETLQVGHNQHWTYYGPNDNRQQQNYPQDSRQPPYKEHGMQNRSMKTNQLANYNELQNLQLENSRLQQKEQQLRTRFKESTQKHNAEIQQKHAVKIQGIRVQMQKLQDDKDEALRRLSAFASASFTHNNPNIADLSDVNRPTKLVERFSELYDNEWTEAYEFLTNHVSMEDKEVCWQLLNELVDAYTYCRDKNTKDTEAIKEHLCSFMGVESLPIEVNQRLIQDRKKCYTNILQNIKMNWVSHSVLDRYKKELEPFISKSLELCWLMTIQDPPVVLDSTTQRQGEIFNKNIYRPFVKSGRFIDYIVWPTLYLHEGGAILSRGVAQGIDA